MIDKKGFVLTETLIVIVFLVTIFTFIYVSIVPLMGKYEDMTVRSSDIDIVYKLYHIRKMITQDANKDTITGDPFKLITCEDFADSSYCNKLMEYLELDHYLLVYADNVNERLTNFKRIASDPNQEIYTYILQYKDFRDNVLVLLDKDTHVIAHLAYH